MKRREGKRKRTPHKKGKEKKEIMKELIHI